MSTYFLQNVTRLSSLVSNRCNNFSQPTPKEKGEAVFHSTPPSFCLHMSFIWSYFILWSYKHHSAAQLIFCFKTSPFYFQRGVSGGPRFPVNTRWRKTLWRPGKTDLRRSRHDSGNSKHFSVNNAPQNNTHLRQIRVQGGVRLRYQNWYCYLLLPQLKKNSCDGTECYREWQLSRTICISRAPQLCWPLAIKLKFGVRHLMPKT